METNFFQQVAALNLTGDLQIIVKQTDGQLVASVLLNNPQCGDNAAKMIPPLLLKGSPTELDSGFFESIATPLQATSGLLVNMETFLKQREEAKKQSAMEKEKTDREKKEKEAKEKRYKDAMAKADELEKEGKYRDAYMKLPNLSEFPEQEEAIRKRQSALSAKFSPGLFDVASATPPPSENTASAEGGLFPQQVSDDTDGETDEEDGNNDSDY